MKKMMSFAIVMAALSLTAGLNAQAHGDRVRPVMPTCKRGYAPSYDIGKHQYVCAVDTRNHHGGN